MSQAYFWGPVLANQPHGGSRPSNNAVDSDKFLRGAQVLEGVRSRIGMVELRRSEMLLRQLCVRGIAGVIVGHLKSWQSVGYARQIHGPQG